MKPLKVLLTANAFYAFSLGALSGGDKRFIEVFKRLACREDYWVELMTIPACEEVARREGFVTRHTHLIPDFRSTSAIGIALDYLLRTIFAVGSFFRLRNQFDVIYNTTDVLTDVVPVYLCHLLGGAKFTWVAAVFHIITHPSQRPGSLLGNWLSYLQQRLCHWMLRRASLIIVDNSHIVQAVADRGINRERIVIAPAGGIDLDRMHATTPSSDTFDALYVGRLHASKGVFDLPAIWSKVCEALPNCTLAIIGTGIDQNIQSLKTALAERHLETSVFLLGSNRDVFAHLKAVRVFIFPSYEEGWGIAICEALASGLPVVGYDLPVYAEVFAGAVQTVKVGDWAGLAQKVIEILSSQPLWQQFSQQSIAVGQRYTWDTLAIREDEMLRKAFYTDESRQRAER